MFYFPGIAKMGFVGNTVSLGAGTIQSGSAAQHISWEGNRTSVSISWSCKCSPSGHWGLMCEFGGLILANGLQPILLIWTPRRGPGNGVQALSLSPAKILLWILLEVNLRLPFFSAEPCWCLILGISRWKMSSLTWSQGFCAMIVIVWRITFPPRRDCGEFSWKIGSGKSQRLRAPGLSSAHLKAGIFWPCLTEPQSVSGLPRCQVW